ncbi:unnamed protein product [Didymodactylos carnosus]|uniref:Uncharacterized protein n=2 Tax=Didymodactylos carnosus TaxID=1234261 RepID=A0A813WC52_9BILA|nr:unnamed protein product [Didymodactylos carnosus]CAF3643584.1 unnamed protein product [Didymodactylos carnosus]
MIICKTHSLRKWFGLVWLMFELNLIGGTILGFSALFKILPKYGVYGNYCLTTITGTVCDRQTKKYQFALTLGICFYGGLAVFLGILIDYFGSRFVKLIAIIFHVTGWLSLALVLIDSGRSTLKTLSFIWMTFGILMFGSSCLFMDWKFPLLNLPYKFDSRLEEIQKDIIRKYIFRSYGRYAVHKPFFLKGPDTNKIKWYKMICKRKGLWKHLTSPLYILVVLFLSILLIPSTFLSVTWYPWVFYITNQNIKLANQYTFAFNLVSIFAILICPFNGFMLGFRADRSHKQKLLNISLMQTISWILSIILCIICLFVNIRFVIPALVLRCLARATIVSGGQAVIATFFPSEHIGTLSGVMWTAWAITLVLVVLMLCHLIQIWFKYIKEKNVNTTNDVITTRF